MDDDPLILTAEFEDVAQAWLEAKRQEHFPPERNFIPAHLTLFHKLPGEQLEAICDAIKTECEELGEPLGAHVAGVRFLGRGSAFEVSSPHLVELRTRLADRFEPWLTRQDSQPWRPHVTFQNKVKAAEAKRVYGEQAAVFEPFDTHVIALNLWRYRGGPWELCERFAIGSR